jgi:two-component system sensor histidine kinase YesM
MRKNSSKILKLFGDMKISAKIRLCMFSVIMLLTIFLCIFTRSYFNKLYYEEVEVQMQDTMNVISNSLINTYESILTNVINCVSSTPIQRVVVNARDKKDYKNNEGIQLQLINLLNSNNMIDSVFLINKDGTYYTIYSYGVRQKNKLINFLNSNDNIEGITWLQYCQSPFLQQQDVIPIVVPLSTLSPGDNVVIANQSLEPVTNLVILLNLEKFQTNLSLSSTNHLERNYFVVNAKGESISLKPDDEMEVILHDHNFIHGVKESSDDYQIHQISDVQNHIVYSQKLPFSNLKLISIISEEFLNHKIYAMNRFILLLGAAGIALSALFSIIFTKFVTSPLNRLMRSIKEIQENQSYTPCEFRYEDEIGQLNHAVKSMYETIQAQISQMKKDEREKYQLEIQLLAEQINPHLLYNTLEGINLEVLNNHTLVASSMINKLGTFMRIGLNYGEELIKVKDEISHVEAYVSIMNHRISKSIIFNVKIEDDLSEKHILKLILQPLVENAIKHGFKDEMMIETIYIPTIDVQIYRDNNKVCIEVSDNGCGIDVEKAKKAVYEKKEEKQHIGLHNVYARLKIYYRQVDMDFQTIPYYRNSVIITIPDEK